MKLKKKNKVAGLTYDFFLEHMDTFKEFELVHIPSGEFVFPNSFNECGLMVENEKGEEYLVKFSDVCKSCDFYELG